MSGRYHYEQMQLNQSVAPDAHGTGTVNGSAVDTADFDEALILLDVGAMGVSGTIDVKVQEDDNSGMSSPTDITNAAFTQKVDGTDDNTVFVGHLNLRNPSRERYIRVVSVVGTAASDHAVSVLLLGKRTRPNLPYNVDGVSTAAPALNREWDV